jgi:hypothetical protein
VRGRAARDDVGIDDESAVGDTADAVDVDDALLEQVAGALRALGDEAQCVVRLDVLGEHEHADLGVRRRDLGRRLQNLGDGNYQLNWKSPTSCAGSCKRPRLDLGEASYHTADFKFTR